MHYDLSLIPLFHRFPFLCDDVERLESFWTEVFSSKNTLNELLFPNLKKLISGLLCLPLSSAGAKRVFSQLNLIKTKTRNSLSIETCDALLRTKELIFDKECYMFKPPLSLLCKKIEYNTCSSVSEPQSEDIVEHNILD